MKDVRLSRVNIVPAFPNHVLAVAVEAKATTRNLEIENFIFVMIHGPEGQFE